MKRSKKIKIEYKDPCGRMTPMLSNKEVDRLFKNKPLKSKRINVVSDITVFGNYSK